MELIAVVAVLAAVLVIAAPNLAVIARGAEMNRLDNYAKELYVAASDQFVGMESTGEYIQFNHTVASAPERNLGSLNAMPQDASGVAWRGFYYLESNGAEEADAAFAKIMDRTSVIQGLASGGRYIAEVSPRQDGTDVYSVFYSEDPAFSYDDVVELASRERDDRLDTGNGYPVGYYCGLSSQGNEMPDRFRPRASFINGEELFLNVACTGGLALAGNESGMLVKVALTDGAAIEVLSLTGGQDFHLDASGNIDIDIVLDSMRPGMHLADIAPSFKPGADLLATVEVSYTDADGTTVSTPAGLRAQARANSLYAKNSTGLIEVANVRHLANLALLPEDAFAVRQVASINFDATTWGRTENTRLSSATIAYNESTYALPYVNPLDPRTIAGAEGFAPIQTSSGDAWSFDGQGNTIANFLIRGTGPTGLFATVGADQIVSNVTLVDTTVEGQGPAGTLAGELLGRIENSGARLDVSSESDDYKQSVYLVNTTGAGPVGGLVGQASGSAVIERSYAAVDVVGVESVAVGGLVGSFAGEAVSTCYASGVVDGGNAVGGLIGAAEGAAIQDCYATSDIGNASVAGGLIGSARGGSVWDCKAYGRVSVSGGGAFVGAASGTDFQNCRYLVQSGYNDGLAAQPQGVEGADLATLAAARLAADHSHPYRARLLGSAFPFAPVLDDHWGNWPDPASMRPTLLYYEHYADGSYGYFGVGHDESGDIPFNTLDETLVVLDDGYALCMPYKVTGFDYAINGGSSYRAKLGAEPSAGTFVELPTVADPTRYAMDVGTDYEEEPSYYLYYWQGDAMVPLTDYHIYQLPADLQLPERVAASYYDSLVINLAEADGISASGYVFYYNPDFAKMATSPKADGSTDVPSNPEELLVRTARQLNRLGYQPLYWDAQIVQGRDIDFGYYTKNYLGQAIDYMVTTGPFANQPIGLYGHPFTGVFDGKDHAIIDYGQSTSGQTAAGFFGCVSGTVRNVHLAASVLNAVSVARVGAVVGSYTPSVGALAGLVEGGTIDGCSVSGYQVSFASDTRVDTAVAGGLVGLNLGSVVSSTAANVTIANNAPSNAGATLGIGGLVGGSAGNVLFSYAVENNLSCRTDTDGSGRTIAYGGLIGAAFEGGPEASSCYAYAYATETVCSASDTVDYYALANPFLIAVYDCYYLDVEEDYQEGENGAIACDPAGLQNASIAGMTGGLAARSTYGKTMSGHVVQQSASYPYPVVCHDAYGDLAHYGFSWWE